MSKDTRITWADHTWNPWTGCVPVSTGCFNCYAMALAERRRGTPAFPNGFDLTLRPHKIREPLSWKEPARIFVNSMSDMFMGAMPRYPEYTSIGQARHGTAIRQVVPPAYLRACWNTMLEGDWHQYQILTKRPKRALRFINELGLELAPHIWIGVSVENQHWADIRIPQLLAIPAAVRFLSLEPLLGPIDVRRWLGFIGEDGHCSRRGYDMLGTNHVAWGKRCPQVRIHQVIDGGESGPGRRPANPDWFRANRDACVEAGVAYFHKQGNAAAPGRDVELDGEIWHQYPVALPARAAAP